MIMLTLKIATFVCAAFLLIQTESLRVSPCSKPVRRAPSVNPSRQFAVYDANVEGVITWSPSEAAEFVLWHRIDPRQTGQQLAPMIKDWSGNEVGEFLNKVFIGRVNELEDRIDFCPSNVRDPQWLGLNDEGFEALEELLLYALPDTILAPEGLSRCAQAFLTKEHRWPSTTKNNDGLRGETEYEIETFAGLGHGKDFAKVLGSVRRKRLSEFTANDIVKMLTLPEHCDKAQGYSRMPDFYNNLGVKLTSAEKVSTVEQLALSGWAPSALSKFVSTIYDVEEEVDDTDRPLPKLPFHLNAAPVHSSST